MPAIRIPIGMSDVVILLGSQRQADRATRRILADSRPITTGHRRRGFGEARKRRGGDAT